MGKTFLLEFLGGFGIGEGGTDLHTHACSYPDKAHCSPRCIIWAVKVAKHSFQVPMPNSPLLLNYL